MLFLFFLIKNKRIAFIIKLIIIFFVEVISNLFKKIILAIVMKIAQIKIKIVSLNLV